MKELIYKLISQLDTEDDRDLILLLAEKASGLSKVVKEYSVLDIPPRYMGWIKANLNVQLSHHYKHLRRPGYERFEKIAGRTFNCDNCKYSVCSEYEHNGKSYKMYESDDSLEICERCNQRYWNIKEALIPNKTVEKSEIYNQFLNDEHWILSKYLITLINNKLNKINFNSK